VADAEPRDRHMIGELVGGKDAEDDVFVAAAFELPRGPDPHAVAIQEHAEQGLGVVGRVPLAVVAVGSVEGFEVDLADDVEDEPGEVAGGEPVAQVRGAAGRAGRGRRAGSCRPWPFLPCITFAANALLLNRVLRKGRAAIPTRSSVELCHPAGSTYAG
jgi:hypothetical protein